jgi:hypothetical protein
LANKNIIVAISETGGHVCYFTGMNGQKRWYPLVSSEYLDAVIELKESGTRMKTEAEPISNIANAVLTTA